jgi:K+/H+ antiporter YhaU regulatory subunit KhtT
MARRSPSESFSGRSTKPSPGGYVVRDADGNAIAYLYGRDNEVDARQEKTLTNEEARRIAFNIAQMPDLLGR